MVKDESRFVEGFITLTPNYVSLVNNNLISKFNLLPSKAMFIPAILKATSYPGLDLGYSSNKITWSL